MSGTSSSDGTGERTQRAVRFSPERFSALTGFEMADLPRGFARIGGVVGCGFD